jgi:flagellar FliL protein
MSDAALTDDEAPTIDAAEHSAGGRSRKKLILFIAAPVLLLLVVGAGLYFTGIIGKLMGGDAEAQKAEEKPAAPKQTVFYDLPDLLVNLNSVGRKTSFLKMSISLEVESQADLARLQGVMPRIIDNFQVYLRELRVEDLRGSSGLYRLREELLLRVNAAAAPAKVDDVLFREMLVQ